MSVASKSGTMNVRRRKGSQHDKTGCLTCRYRRKKCTQNTFPVCGTCSRLNLECVREPPRRVVPSQPPHAVPPKGLYASSASPRLASMLSPTFAIQVQSPLLCKTPEGVSSLEPTSAHHQFAMRYYVSELASHFSVSPNSNSFLSEFLPMAMQSAALRESLLSLATSHISLSNSTYTEASLESRAKAIMHLKNAIEQPQPDLAWSQVNAATCLVFAMGLITTSDSEGWYFHMQGAKHFILSAKGTAGDGSPLTGIDCLKQTVEGRWILRNFAYHDVLGCVTLRCKPLLEPDYISELCDEVDSYMGIGTRILLYIGKVQELTYEFAEIAHGGDRSVFSQDFNRRWTRLEKELQDWVCPAKEDEESLSHIAMAYRSVALLLLYRLVRRQALVCGTLDLEGISQTQAGDDFDPGTVLTKKTLGDLLQSKISFHVSETVRHISAIPVWSDPEAAILFPLFIAGGETQDKELIEKIKTRLGHNLARRQFRNISRAMSVLEVVWETRRGLAHNTESDSRQVGWEDVLDQMNWELVLT